MEPGTSAFVVIGSLMFVALAVDAIAGRIRLPRVTLLLAVGVLAGPLALDVLPSDASTWFPIVSQVALVMVGFLIGAELTAERMRELGRDVAVLTAVQGVVTAAVVAGGLVLVGTDLEVALLLGGVATATDPAATKAVIDDERARGPTSDRLLGVVAIDDVIGIVVFSVLLATAGVLSGEGGVGAEVATGAWEIGGGVAVGVALGLPGAWLTDRIRPGSTTLEEALGLVFLCTGLSAWLDVSYLLAAVALGATIASRATNRRRPMESIEGVEWPFLVLFFVLAGASVGSGDMAAAGVAVLGYLVTRTAGKIAGGWAGTRLVSGPASHPTIGLGLLPQAGVALGMALATLDRLPALADDVVSVAVVSTVVFELVGPIGVRMVVRDESGGSGQGDGPGEESPRGESNS